MADGTNVIYQQIRNGPVLAVLRGNVTIGSSGAITASDTRGFTVAHGATGIYTVTFFEVYTSLVFWTLQAASAINAFKGRVDASTVNLASKTLDTVWEIADGTDTDPASENILYFKFELVAPAGIVP